MTKTTKIALVTGANKGIGKEIARQLGQQGVTVLVGARDIERGERAAEEVGAVGSVRLDVTDAESVADAVKRVEHDFGRLDILVNNAGIALDRAPVTELPIEVLRQTYETNVFGVAAVTNAFLPLLRKSASPRIVNVSSALGSITAAANQDEASAGSRFLGYNSSKSALNAMTVIYANELRDAGVKVNAINPGYCATDLNGHQGDLDPAQGAAVAVGVALSPDDGPTGEFHTEGGTLPW
ncbi:MAG: dehydrogenase [Amycolatopsis sp.]|jgi:NAD(P)-dependent dehydrogenase (short-subunit alcohol dehydrogenase family)|uniref:SDR family oxidoreductase n=1 Tax=Amycolatopsis sp. TaxID=37632 RepID=UPI00261B7CC3|nr:SDR family oxidoreductase [Amycolatopsis sp.]MCU1684105.1 dehydrogenase [Amycolatopsis sp.]